MPVAACRKNFSFSVHGNKMTKPKACLGAEFRLKGLHLSRPFLNPRRLNEGSLG